MNLYDALKEYGSSDACPFHMPGHKRHLGSMADPFSIDITEIDGFDDLHHAEGILKDAQERAAVLYGSSETHFLVNGSTAGILAAVSACARAGAEAAQGHQSGTSPREEDGPPALLLARNCHKSAWNAAYINRLDTVSIQPRPMGDLNGPIDPEAVAQALRETERPCAVLITSPTYDGIVSDVKSIAQTAHRCGVPLIVDEAHGAHFGMHTMFPPSSVRQGADIVIHSLHKTLPSLTQTALIHVNGDLVGRRTLRRMLQIFQTSSPSYVLMASIDSCIGLLEKEGPALFDAYAGRLCSFRSAFAEGDGAREMEHLEFLKTDDSSRILVKPRGMTAKKLYDTLRLRYHIQPEMCTPAYVLLLSSVADDGESFERLGRALREINREIGREAEQAPEQMPGQAPEQAPVEAAGEAPGGVPDSAEASAADPAAGAGAPRLLRLDQAVDGPSEKVPLGEAAGRISAEFLYLYPPGIPLVTPGELFTEELVRTLMKLKKDGWEIRGAEDETLRTVLSVKTN